MPMMLYISSPDFEMLGLRMMLGDKLHWCCNKKIHDQRFRAWFGADATHCSLLWQLLLETPSIKLPHNPDPKHLLWSLLFLKQYSTEQTHAAQVGTDEKTFRKWAWLYTGALAKLAPRLVSLKLEVATGF